MSDVDWIAVGNLNVRIVRKPIKNLYLSVRASDGSVRASVPQRMSLERVREFIVDRQAWIAKHQAAAKARSQPLPLQMITGETIPLFGENYHLEIIERTGKGRVSIANDTLLVRVPPDTTTTDRLAMLDNWYRARLQSRIPVLLDRWQPRVGKYASAWSIRKMKTRWGSCNTVDRRICLNLELAKQPIDCLEYVIVHELVHLWERYHNARFYAYLDEFFPQWRDARDRLKRSTIQ